MQELARVTLDNEMDLILAHKRSMKLAELVGLSMSAQTTFATAVSEVARNTIEAGKSGYLTLRVEAELNEHFIVACIRDQQLQKERTKDGLEYAKKLVNKYNITTLGAETSIELFYQVHLPFKIDIYKLDEWRNIFRNELPISPYEELKRKNEQLRDLSEKVQKSEAQYKTLTNSLPLIIFSLDETGKLTYANEWLTLYTGQTLESLDNTKWKTVVHEADYDTFLLLLTSNLAKDATAVKINTRLRNTSGDYLWHQVSLSPFSNEKKELQYWIGFIVDIHAQKVFEETLKDNVELKQTQEQLKQHQQTLEQYNVELNRSNLELQQFAFVASHDLQEPVRKMLYYSDLVSGKYKSQIDEKGAGYLNIMKAAAQRMRRLIQDLLLFSQINKEGIQFNIVDLGKVAKNSLLDFDMIIAEKKATLDIGALPEVNGDERMLQQLFENIISNALKYSSPGRSPHIQISASQNNGHVQMEFRDNGIGFDEKYLPQIFTLFQRLHTRENYEGTGLGLSICRKITEMHHGKIWAESKEGEGSVFYVALPKFQPQNT